MAIDATMRPESTSTRAPDSVAWEAMQETVRSFRRALSRGERPAIEAHLPRAAAERRMVLRELIHEELDVRIKAGDWPGLGTYLERFPEVADDAGFLADLAGAEAALGRRRDEEGRTDRPCGGEVGTRGSEHLSAAAPSSIGRYELGDVIGRGAFGVVHRAYDTTLRRAVALKRPRPGAVERPAAVERFLREARAVAGLRHPGIVAVHDAGQADGELYLVSDLIEGRNLAEELAGRRPSFRRSAGWVAALAEALAHAHGLGVIHRDVKPSNVLIDADDRVFLTDFGLAKSDGGEATLTLHGQVVGTPAYMAPEQAGAEKGPVDARTDVYSLGVVLYELLTGSRPFVGTGPMLLARIREEEPKPPRRLDDAIPRDLETVCLKAMAKRPGDRYADAASFAADLRRWLRGEPVLARLVGPVGRFARICRRKPALSGLAASLILAVIAGFIGVTREWRRAESFRRRAEANLAVAREEGRRAELNLTEAQRQRTRATDALAQGTRTLTALAELTDERMITKAAFDRETLRNLLFEHHRGFVRHLKDDPAFLPELARASLQIASLLESSGSLEQAISSWKDTRALFERLVGDDPANSEYRSGLAHCHRRLGLALRQTARAAEADGHLRRGEEVWRGSLEIARRRLETAPQDGRARTTVAVCEIGLGESHVLLGESEQAIVVLRRGHERVEQLLRESPADLELHSLAASSCSFMARLLNERHPEESVALARFARDHGEVLLRADPANAGSLRCLADAIYWLASLEDRADRMDEALRDFQRAAGLYQRLSDNKPFVIDYKGALGATWHNIGHILVEVGRPAEALNPYHKAIALREELVRLSPDNIHGRCNCTGSWYRLGEALEHLSRIPEAVEAYRNCLAHQRQVYAREPAEIKHRHFLDERLRQVFGLLLVLGRTGEAVELARERKALWHDDPAVLLGVAGELAAAAVRFRPGECLVAAAGDRQRRRYLVEALAAWRDAARHTARESHLAGTPGR
jgi:eukaryotic-like serine/threonine-protein kinase